MTTPAFAKPIVAVLRLSNAFRATWSTIADELCLPVVETESPEALWKAGAGSMGLIASCGVEGRAVAALRSGKLGSATIAVIGTDPGHRTAVAMLSAGATEYFALPHDVELLREWIREQASLFGARGHGSTFVDPGDEDPSEDGAAPPTEILPFPATMREITRRAASAMVEQCGGNKSEAARRLAISRTRLLRLLTVDHGREVATPRRETLDRCGRAPSARSGEDDQFPGNPRIAPDTGLALSEMWSSSLKSS